MKKKKIPLRKCLGCNESKPKRELIRVVKNKENEIKLDLIGKINGRGAYICNDTECFEKARGNKRINRALEIEIPKELYNKILEEIKDDK